MKKVLCILMAVTGVFVFVGLAGAQTTCDDKCNNTDCCAQTGYPNECDISTTGCTTKTQGCLNCNKCSLQNVPCPEVISGVGQGADTSTESCPFDYDDSYGYCTSNEGNTEFDMSRNGIAARNCRFIINICECPAACEIGLNERIGIQMQILTPGVFWADNSAVDGKATDAVSFEMYPPTTNTCNVTRTFPKKFKEVKYYESLNTRSTGSGRVVYEPVSEGVPAANCFAGNVQPGNRVQVLQSETSGDYKIVADDLVGNKCLWVIDIPAMRLDNTATRGDVIKVRVRLLWNREEDQLLCRGCIAADICECVREVGIVCCSAKSTETGCMFFPYVLQGLQESSGWVSGVAVSAVGLTALPDKPYCKLTLQDQEGNTATWTNEALNRNLVWAFVLDNIMANFDKTLAPGACSLKVESNYPIDGYTFMNANLQFGTGTMPRGCGTRCAPNSN